MGASNAKEDIKDLAKQTKIDQKVLEAEYKRFKKAFDSDGINKKEFEELARKVLSKDQQDQAFIDRLFAAFDKDGSGKINFSEFTLTVGMLTSKNPEDTLKFVFSSLDLDNSGFLDKRELYYPVQLLFQNNPGIEKKVPDTINSPEKLLQQIFKHADANKDGKLQVDELIDLMTNNKEMFNFLGLTLIFLS